jgi:uncharacterized membrane protein
MDSRWVRYYIGGLALAICIALLVVIAIRLLTGSGAA